MIGWLDRENVVERWGFISIRLKQAKVCLIKDKIGKRTPGAGVGFGKKVARTPCTSRQSIRKLWSVSWPAPVRKPGCGVTCEIGNAGGYPIGLDGTVPRPASARVTVPVEAGPVWRRQFSGVSVQPSPMQSSRVQFLFWLEELCGP